jgi:hypothetical protein
VKLFAESCIVTYLSISKSSCLVSPGKARSYIDSFKYLGVTIQQNLTWSEHIDNISKKFNQRLGCHIKFLLPIQARLTLYNSLVLPLLDNSDIVWEDKNNYTLMNHLQVRQHNAARLILDLPRHSSATEALETLEWKPLYPCRKYHRCISVFKCLNHLVLNHRL